MTKLNINKTGLALGIFLAVIHAIWSLAIAIIPNTLQSFINWIFELHALEPYWIITSFNLLNAIFLVVMTLVIGYVLGVIFAYFHNVLHKK